MSFWAITPIKSFKRPKSRLGDVLTLEDRRVLVKFMLEKILLSQRKSRLFSNYLIVTEDANVVSHVKKIGFTAFLQKKPGLNNGITEASKRAIRGGAKGILIIHGDIPRTSSSILQSVTKKHKKLYNFVLTGLVFGIESRGLSHVKVYISGDSICTKK